MNVFFDSPSSESILCSSSDVPNVTTARHCVSPLINKAEPCVLGSIPTLHMIFLISSGLRPSALKFFSKIMFRTSVFSIPSNTLAISLDISFSPTFRTSIISLRILLSASCLLNLSGIVTAPFIFSKERFETAFSNSLLITGGATGLLFFPISFINCFWISTIRFISLCAISIASSNIDSLISSPPPSTMRTASSVPATTRLKSHSSVSLRSGFTTKELSIIPTLTAPTIPSNGISDTPRAADIPTIPRTSAMFSSP